MKLIARTGRGCTRNLHIQLGKDPSKSDPLVGQVLTPDLARLIVTAVNALGWDPESQFDLAHAVRVAEIAEQPPAPTAEPRGETPAG